MTTHSGELPSLANEYPLSPEQVRQFQQQGHILLRAVASTDEVAAFRPSILQARERYGQEAAPMAQRDTYGKAFLKGMNLWPKDEAVKRFVLAHRFAQIAAELLGMSGVRIYHDQALLKEPGGGLTPWHQDQHYWPLVTDHTITMWMPMVDATYEMGTMHFASGSHKEGYLGDLPISDDSQARFDAFIHEKGFPIVPGSSMVAGDATFHYGWTLHGAPGNSSTCTREVMTIIYYPDGTLVGPLDNASRQRDRDRWLPGCQPGQLAASELNPVVFRR